MPESLLRENNSHLGNADRLLWLINHLISANEVRAW